MQAFARYIMRGRLQAILVAAVAALLSLILPPLNYISSAVVALVTLRRGWNEGLIVLVGAAAGMAVFAGLTPVDPLHALLLAAAVWVPVWLLALVLRYTVSLSTMVGVAALVGCLIVVGIYGIFDDPAQTWRNLLGELVEQARQQNETAAADAFGQMLESTAPYLTGMLVAALMLGLTLSVFLGRWWQAILYNPGGFAREFQGLRLGRQYSGVALLALAGALAGDGWLGEVAGNALIVIMAGYLLHSLGLMHGVAEIKGINVGWLIAVYAMTFILPQSALLLAAAAFVDSWMDIRARIRRDGGGGETD